MWSLWNVNKRKSAIVSVLLPVSSPSTVEHFKGVGGQLEGRRFSGGNCRHTYVLSFSRTIIKELRTEDLPTHLVPVCKSCYRVVNDISTE